MPFPSYLRALNSRNYRLFFVGQWVSLVGTWMTNTASVWLAYELSRSPFIAGLLAFASQIPLLVLAPLGGVLGDRGDKRGLLMRIQVVCALLSVCMAVFIFLNYAGVALLVAAAGIRGLINSAEFPTRQSFIVEMVDDKRDLSNAIALNSSMFNIARLIGPSIAGFLIVFAGAGWCFILDGASFLVAMYALHIMRLEKLDSRREPKHPLVELREGFRYVAASPALRAPLIVVPLVCFSGFAGTVLAPVYAKDVFHSDARSLGILLSSMGVGALCSALFLGARKSAQGLPTWIFRGAVLTALSQLGLCLSITQTMASFFLMVNGAGVVLVLAGSNTLIQSQVEDSVRGRVMGLFVMGQGLYPVGSLIIGALASGFGVRIAVGTCALITIFAAGLFLRQSKCQA
jgi:MFS family permease